MPLRSIAVESASQMGMADEILGQHIVPSPQRSAEKRCWQQQHEVSESNCGLLFFFPAFFKLMLILPEEWCFLF